MEIDKQKTTIFVLVFLLILSTGYIVMGKYQEAQQQEQLSIFQQGAQYGYEQAIIQLVQQAATCQQVSVRVQNQTVNMIAVECLQQQNQS